MNKPKKGEIYKYGVDLVKVQAISKYPPRIEFEYLGKNGEELGIGSYCNEWELAPLPPVLKAMCESNP